MRVPFQTYRPAVFLPSPKSLHAASPVALVNQGSRRRDGVHTYDTASCTPSSVTGLLGLLVSALAKVVSAGVNDNGALQKLCQYVYYG